MDDKPFDGEAIEQAFQPAVEILGKLPAESIERKRAAEHLDIAEQYVHRGRERTQPPTELPTE